MIRRREFLAALASAAGWPLVSQGQQPSKLHRIAVVHPSNPVSELTETGVNPGYQLLFQELRRLGYVEGGNLVVERYSAEGRLDRFQELARDVVLTKPDLIHATSNPLILSFKAATDTIPIVG